ADGIAGSAGAERGDARRDRDEELPTERSQPARRTLASSDDGPPARPSVTISLADAPVPSDRGSATARIDRFDAADITTPAAPGLAALPSHRFEFEHEVSTTQRARLDPTTTTAAPRIDDEVTQHGPVAHLPGIDDTSSGELAGPDGEAPAAPDVAIG